MADNEPIAFVDLAAQQQRIKDKLEAALARVLAHGQYIMGPEVAELEARLVAFSGARYCITCANGTDALTLVLMACEFTVTDAVIVPSFTFAATAEAVVRAGATPVFADILPGSFNLDPDSFEQAIAAARSAGLTPRAVIPVDLFGQPADYARIEAIVKTHDLKILCDAAQSFGATQEGRSVGNIGYAAATSFFPTKPLGCYGDGGAIFTNDAALHATLVSLRAHGKGSSKYDYARIGVNSRLDTLQAAILLEKLLLLPQELKQRQDIAQYYTDKLSTYVQTPLLMPGMQSAWACYTITLPAADTRTQVQDALKAQGIPTMVYYPMPLHRQLAYKAFPAAGGLAVSEDMCARVLSLPMHPYLTEPVMDRIVACIIKALA